jgi:Protein of unknown function (DUF3602)
LVDHGDDEIVPEQAIRKSMDESHHVGRGGAGNAVHEDPTFVKQHEGLADKLKNKLFKKKVEQQTATTTET